MAEETRENILQVELAIQRELAYRQKVAMLHLQPDVDYGIDLMPLQQVHPSSLSLCPRSNSSPSPCLSGIQRQAPTSSLKFLPPQQVHPSSLSLRPRSNSSPSPCLSGIQRQAPTSSLEFLPPQQARLNYNSHDLKNQTDNFFCKVCQVPCSGAKTYKQHTKGHKHRAKIQEVKFGRKDVGDDNEVAKQRWRCGLCDIWCMNEDSFRQHLEGQKHKDEQRKQELAKNGGISIEKKRKRCELCNIWCTDYVAFKLHIMGKKHSLLAMEKMKRA